MQLHLALKHLALHFSSTVGGLDLRGGGIASRIGLRLGGTARAVKARASAEGCCAENGGAGTYRHVSAPLTNVRSIGLKPARA